MREIKTGQAFPLAGFFKRTGPLHFETRQFVIRIPVWLHFCTRYYIVEAEFLTSWWVKVLHVCFERGITAPALCLRIMWGDFPILRREKPYVPKFMNDG